MSYVLPLNIAGSHKRLTSNGTLMVVNMVMRNNKTLPIVRKITKMSSL